MASRRDVVAMTDEEVEAYLDQQRTLNVAMLGPSGHPHLVATWYVMSAGRPVFWTFERSQRVVNIRRDARVSALVQSGGVYSELRGVEMRGTARLIEDRDEVLEIGKAVALKYTGPAGAGALAFLEKQAEQRIGVRIDVDQVVSWDHTKLDGTR